MSDRLKFGPPPETNARLWLALHFVICVAVLSVVRPPLVTTNCGGLRVLLVLLLSAALTWFVGAIGTSV